MFLLAIWVKNRRPQINDKLGIIFIIKGPLGRKNKESIHRPLESFNHSSLSPSLINYGREKNIPIQILTDKYGCGVSFGE